MLSSFLVIISDMYSKESTETRYSRYSWDSAASPSAATLESKLNLQFSFASVASEKTSLSRWSRRVSRSGRSLLQPVLGGTLLSLLQVSAAFPCFPVQDFYVFTRDFTFKVPKNLHGFAEEGDTREPPHTLLILQGNPGNLADGVRSNKSQLISNWYN